MACGARRHVQARPQAPQGVFARQAEHAAPPSLARDRRRAAQGDPPPTGSRTMRSNGMLIYPVVIQRDGKGFVAKFPDIPEALTSAGTRAEALEMAQDALECAMEFYFEDHRQVPLPSRPTAGQDVVELPASLSAKVLLLNELLAQGVTPAELARRLQTSPQAVQRI